MKILVLVLCVVTVVNSSPVPDDSNDPILSQIDQLSECLKIKNDALCVKEQAYQVLTKVEGARSLTLFNGVTFLNSSPRKSRSLEPLSPDNDVRSKQLTERLWKSTTELLETGDVEISFGGDDDESESRAINEVDDESRGKKKKLKKTLKFLIPLLLLAKAKAVALSILALLVIAASIAKIALIAKIAFIIKIIALIKALLAKKHSQEETWEVAPSHGWEPHVEHHAHVEHGHGGGWEGGWSRSRNEANNLAYSAYTN